MEGKFVNISDVVREMMQRPSPKFPPSYYCHTDDVFVFEFYCSGGCGPYVEVTEDVDCEIIEPKQLPPAVPDK